MYVGKFMINIMLKHLHEIFIMYVGMFVENIMLMLFSNLKNEKKRSFLFEPRKVAISTTCP